jgi:hypothetical protein
MKKLISLFLLIPLSLYFTSCNLFDDSDSPDSPQSEIGKYNTGDFGEIVTETGESIKIIPGVIPQNSNGEAAEVTFTIETQVEDPGRLGDGATFKSDLVKFGPEYFNFRWPVQLSIPYDENLNPNTLYVMHYDYGQEKWVKLSKAGIDYENKTIFFNTLSLGVFGLAELTTDYRDDLYWCDGGVRYTDGTKSYFYTFTVASVQNPKYEWQTSWLPPVGYVVGSTGSQNNSPLAYTWGFLVQASYQIWISRTKPGTYWELPVLETYTLPASATLTEPNICPQSATTFPDLNMCEPWVDLTLPSGGEWVPGSPQGWAAPTITYGTGDFQATLNWINNESHSTDLDLHLYGPNDMHVYYEYDMSQDGSLALDRDWRYTLGNATENIYSLKDMPSGNYQIKVVLYGGNPVSFNARIIRFGEIKNFSGSVSETGEEILIDEFSR